jgi:membrane protein
VWVGAVATAIFFVIGKLLIGLYIGQSDPGSAFGAAGALAVLLVWIYYAAVILLLGAEFTQAWMKLHGRTIEPEKGAVRIVDVKKRVTGSLRRTREKKAQRTLCPTFVRVAWDQGRYVPASIPIGGT